MAEARPVQRSFASGVLSRGLQYRNDLAKYDQGLAYALNAMVRPEGGAMNRPGLEFVGFQLDETTPAFPIEFEAADNDSYMLEFAPNKMRIIRNGAFVTYASGPNAGQIVVIDTPYDASRLPLLKYEQANDVITIVNGVDDIYELRRLDNDNWQFLVQTFQAPANHPTGLSVVATDPYAPGGGVVAITHTYAVSAILDTGAETVLSPDKSADNILGYTQNYNTISWSAPAGVTVTRYAVYKKRNGYYGLIGYTPDLTFKDDNIQPDFTFGAVEDSNPFEDADAKPSVVSYFQQRRVFAATAKNPFNIYGTRAADLSNMSTSNPGRDDDAYIIPTTGTKRQKILHMVPLANLLLFTQGGVWYLTGEDEVITPSSYAHKAASYTCADIRPCVHGNRITFVESDKKSVREIQYSFANNAYDGDERTILSRDYFKKRNIIGVAYAERPHSVQWVWCDDGAFFAFTYLPEHDVFGWVQQETDGFVEFIRVVREGNDDVPYFFVRRTLNGVERRTIERMHTRNFDGVEDAFFVDCGLTYEGSPVNHIFGLDHLEGEAVSVLADGAVVPGRTIVGGAVTPNLETPASTVHVGKGYAYELETLELDTAPQNSSGLEKSVGQLTIAFEETRGGLVGSSWEKLRPIKRQSSSGYGPLDPFTGDVEVTCDPEWGKRGHIFIRQSDPLPITVLAITPRLEIDAG